MLHTLAPITPLPAPGRRPPPQRRSIRHNARMSPARPDTVSHDAASSALSDTRLIGLIDRVAARDASALKQLYDATSGKLFGLAMRVVGQREAAEDVLQEAFLTIWRVAGDYRASLSPPMAWLGLIVRSRALDQLRRRASDRSNVTQELDEMMAETLEGESANPMDTTQASEQAWALHQCLSQLEAKQREVVSLAYLRDLTHSELAERLKLPLGTVKTWIRRGLDQMRQCMARFA
jgi:RNA polymerase sigma-70 factor (ECF subfamily)